MQSAPTPSFAPTPATAATPAFMGGPTPVPMHTPGPSTTYARTPALYGGGQSAPTPFTGSSYLSNTISPGYGLSFSNHLNLALISSLTYSRGRGLDVPTYRFFLPRPY